MDRDEVIRPIREALPELRQYRFKSLWVFGSVARNEAGEESDVDVLVEFPAVPDLLQFMGLKFALEDLLGCRVDLLDRDGLRPRWRRAIEEGALLVA